YSHEAERQDDLNFQVDQLWPMVQAGAPEPSSDQEERLEIAQEELQAQQEAFPTRMGHTELMETLLKLANEHNVSLNLQAQLSPAEFGEGGGYFMMRSGARASGNLSDLVSFIAHLEDGPMETLSLEQVNLSGSGGSWSASFTITIYTKVPLSVEAPGQSGEEDV
ncbi:MAG: hypothetical protein GY845_22175, partial [Planctomycetes bacterium]|nr:hypothetical protein [Planctomycetota bacterium]